MTQVESEGWPHVKGCKISAHLGLTCLQAEGTALSRAQEDSEQTVPALDYDPWQHRRRISLSRAMMAAVLDLREDVHIIGMDVLSDPMWLNVTLVSPRFPIIDEHWEQRIEMGRTEPSASGPHWREETYEGGNPRGGAIQIEREPGWVEGWRKAIEWLREYHGDVLARIDIAAEMETRLP